MERRASPRQAGGAWTVADSSSPVGGSTSLTFSALKTSTTYELVWAAQQQGTTADEYQLRFNGDSGSNYRWAVTITRDNASSTVQSASGTECRLAYGSPLNEIAAGDTPMYRVRFRTAPYNTGRVELFLNGSYYSSTDAEMTAVIGSCEYRGASDLSSVTLLPSAGNWRGDATLLELGN